jgi:hypothetical protein
MFNQGAAAGAVGGLGKAMMKAGKDLRQTRQEASGMAASPRQYRKILQASVDAHRQFSEIDTQHHGARLSQQTESALKLGEAGFHTIRQQTPFGTTEVQKDPGATAVGGPDHAYNPSHDVHGHPGAGHVTVHGYSGDAASTPGFHQTNNVYTLPATAVKSSVVQPMAIQGGMNASPRSLEGGKATDMGTQAGRRPSASAPAGPGFKASGSDVIKLGSFMDKPTKAQPAIPSKVSNNGAIPMGSSATKGKLKGAQLMKDPSSGKLTEAGWEAKLSSQEAAHLASKQKKDNY